MNLLVLLTIVFASLCSIVTSLSIRYSDMDDFEIAKMFVAQLYSASAIDSQGEIVYPTPNTTWWVNERVNVTFNEDVPDQTVSIFFFNKTDTLAGGPLNQTTFPFVVPPEAVSVPEDGTSLLLAVRRQSRYLQQVDSVVVHVLPSPI